jgi:hypothetical protein
MSVTFIRVLVGDAPGWSESVGDTFKGEVGVDERESVQVSRGVLVGVWVEGDVKV